MTKHPAVETYVNSTPVAKSGVRAFEIVGFSAVNVADVTSRDLSGTNVVLCPFSNSGRSFWYDSTDTTTAHNGTTCLVDAVGNRFKTKPVVAADLTAAILNSVYSGGTANPDILPVPAASALSVMAFDGAHWVAKTAIFIQTMLDTLIGNTNWRTPFITPANVDVITALPSDAGGRTGGRGNGARAVLFGDGTVGAVGTFVGWSPNGSTSAIYRFQKIAFSDGVARTITKFWCGGGASIGIFLYCIESTTNKVWSVGLNANGQLGVGDTTNRSVWTEITFFTGLGITITDVATDPNGYGAHFIGSNGFLYYTGYNSLGQAGDASTTQKTTPVRSGTLTSVTMVHIGCSGIGAEIPSVGAIAGGTAFVWGYNANHQLGLGNATNQSSPQSSGITNASKIRMGAASLILGTDGKLYSAGYNGDGGPCQGVFSGPTDTNSWTQIASLGTTVIDFESTGSLTVSVAAIITVAGVGRHLRTWGYNIAGQLGNGNNTSQNTIQTPSGSWQGSVNEVAAADINTTSRIVLRVGNRLLNSGYNANGEFGNGLVANSNTFVDTIGIRGNILSWYLFQQNQLGGGMMVTDTTCLSWGHNANGQTGTHEGNLNATVRIPQKVIT